jgi:DNA repair protein RadC
MTRVLTYEQPREKLTRKGAAALTNTELLQVIIASGSAKMPVAKIAKKVAKVLAKSGSMVHPEELMAISGLGKVKTGQILALFELASRFPVLSKAETYNSNDNLISLYQELRKASKQSILYVTFDGGKRLISKRMVILNSQSSFVKQVHQIFAECIGELAASVMIAIGYDQQKIEPELSELSLIHDIYKTSRLVSIPVRELILVSSKDEKVIKESML